MFSSHKMYNKINKYNLIYLFYKIALFKFNKIYYNNEDDRCTRNVFESSSNS